MSVTQYSFTHSQDLQMLYKAKVKGVRDTVISELQEVEGLSLMERSQVENPAKSRKLTNVTWEDGHTFYLINQKIYKYHVNNCLYLEYSLNSTEREVMIRLSSSRFLVTFLCASTYITTLPPKPKIVSVFYTPNFLYFYSCQRKLFLLLKILKYRLYYLT